MRWSTVWEAVSHDASLNGRHPNSITPYASGLSPYRSCIHAWLWKLIAISSTFSFGTTAHPIKVRRHSECSVNLQTLNFKLHGVIKTYFRLLREWDSPQRPQTPCLSDSKMGSDACPQTRAMWVQWWSCVSQTFERVHWSSNTKHLISKIHYRMVCWSNNTQICLHTRGDWWLMHRSPRVHPHVDRHLCDPFGRQNTWNPSIEYLNDIILVPYLGIDA